MKKHHIVALSGGKDSTALALRLSELEPNDYTYICSPTGDEPPELFEHWRKLEALLKKPFVFLSAGVSLPELIRELDMLPNHRARWCTRILKIEPCIDYLDNLEGDTVLYVGLRADEPTREGGVYGDTPQRFPLREWGWGLAEVNGYLAERGITIPARTDCQRCYHQRLSEWWELWKERPETYRSAIADESHVSEARGKKCSFRSPGRDTWPSSLVDLAD